MSNATTGKPGKATESSVPYSDLLPAQQHSNIVYKIIGIIIILLYDYDNNVMSARLFV